MRTLCSGRLRTTISVLAQLDFKDKIDLFSNIHDLIKTDKAVQLMPLPTSIHLHPLSDRRIPPELIQSRLARKLREFYKRGQGKYRHIVSDALTILTYPFTAKDLRVVDRNPLPFIFLQRHKRGVVQGTTTAISPSTTRKRKSRGQISRCWTPWTKRR